jgi:hypothetical protein
VHAVAAALRVWKLPPIRVTVELSGGGGGGGGGGGCASECSTPTHTTRVVSHVSRRKTDLHQVATELRVQWTRSFDLAPAAVAEEERPYDTRDPRLDSMFPYP